MDIFLKNMKKNSKFIFASSMNAFGIDNKRKILKNYFFQAQFMLQIKDMLKNMLKN